MSLILALSPTNTLIAELPGSNGSRRKIDLSANKLSQETIGLAINCLRSIGSIEMDPDRKLTQSKAKDLFDKLQAQIQEATDAANALASILKEDNICLDVIFRILEGQQTNKSKLGEDGEPTSTQVIHWERHGTIIDGEITPKNSFSDPMCAHCKAEDRFEPGKNREKSVRGLSENEALRLGLIYRGYKKSNLKDPTQWTRTNYPTCYLLSDGKVLDSKKIGWLKSHRLALIEDGKMHAKSTGFVPQETKPHKYRGVTVNKGGTLVYDKNGKVEKMVKKPTSTPLSKINEKDLVASF